MTPHFEQTRRDFITTCTATGTAILWSYRLPAADHLQKLSFIIVSDTHLGRKDNKSAENNWRKGIEEINQLPGKFVLHLGDVVDSGRKEQYPIYQETRKLLKKPIHEIPGNHDPTDLFKRHISERIDRSIDEGGVRFVLFNNSHRDSHLGFITNAQIDWLKKEFAEAEEKDLKIIVCCHVPIHTNKPPDRAWYVKPDEGQKKFYELQQKHADRLLACFHGHFHNGIRGWRDHGSTVEALFPSICYNQNRNLKDHIARGKADGFFVNELRAGYVLAELGEGRLTLRYKPLGEKQNGTYSAEWK